MISLLLRDSWKILRNPVAILQELDKDKTKIIDSKWIVDKEMANRSELSEELANFCPQYPIYQVKMMDDSLTSTRVETEGESRTEKFEMRIPKKNRRLNCVRAFLMTFINLWREPKPKPNSCLANFTCCDTFNAVVSFLSTTGTQHRSRRNARSFPPIHPCNLCAGGKGTVTYWDKCWCSNSGGYWKIETKIASRTCVTIRECFLWFCWSKHLVNYVYCSQYVCQRPTYYRPRPYDELRPYDERNASIAL